MARKADVPSITSGQAHYILVKLIDDGTVSAVDVRRALGEMWSEMSTIERRIAELRAASEPMRHPLRVARNAARTVRSAVKRAVSSDVHAGRQLQGQYLGYMKQIAERDRPRFKKMAKDKGREQAVDAMKKSLGK